MGKKRTVVTAPQKHVFKFASFTQQISKLNADTISSTLRLPGETLTHETFFFDAVRKLNDLDYGDDYRAFLDDIPYDELATYAQLLHYQGQIFDALVHHLSIGDSQSITTLLELSVAFVRDLKEDFESRIWDFFDCLIAVLERSAEILEILDHGFKVLAVLFQLNWRSIVKNLRKVFVRFAPLFASNVGYIRRFAAESFSFLLRKSPSVSKLIRFLYEQAHVSEGKHVKDGIVLLLFNGIKGLHKQFHSQAVTLLEEYVVVALEVEFPDNRETVQRILEGVMRLACIHTTREHSGVVTSVILAQLKKQITANSAENVNFLVALMTVWVTERRGNNFVHVREFFVLLNEAVASSDLPRLGPCFPTAVVRLLLTFSTKFDNYVQVRQLLTGTAKNQLKMEEEKLLRPEVVEEVFAFFKSLLRLHFFDVWCVPSVAEAAACVLEAAEADAGRGAALLAPVYAFLAAYAIERRPFEYDFAGGKCKPFFDGNDLFALRSRIVEDIRAAFNAGGASESVNHALTIYPWLWRSGVKPEGLNLLESSVGSMLSDRKSLSRTEALRNFLTIYALAFFDSRTLLPVSVTDTLAYVETNDVSDEVVLRTALLLLLTSAEIKSATDVQRLQWLTTFAGVLQESFVSPASSTRQAALHILCCFDDGLLHGAANGDGEFIPAKSVFRLLLEVEETAPDLRNYRHRVALLRMINPASISKSLPQSADPELRKVPLLVMLSQLFVKFTLLWPSVHEAVNDFVGALTPDNFWQVFQFVLDRTTAKLRGSTADQETSTSLFPFSRFANGDFDAFRIQLFKIMRLIVPVVERKNRIVVEYFLDFYEHEYLPNHDPTKVTVDLTREDDPTTDEISEEPEKLENTDDAEKMDVDDEELAEAVESEGESAPAEPKAVQRKQKTPVTTVRRHSAEQCLKLLLDVFARFSSPKSISREVELQSIYEHLLMSKTDDIRKAAFACLVSYRHPFIKPYTEHIERLLDGATFRDELTKFSVYEEDSVVDAAHRGQLIPYVMKLLYGTMMAPVSKHGNSHRFVIFTFLSRCQPTDLDVFLGVFFHSFVAHFGIELDVKQQSLRDLISGVKSRFNVNSVFAPHKLKSLLNNAQEVLKRLNSVLSRDQAAFLMRLVFVAGTQVQLVLSSSDQVKPFVVGQFRALRTQLFDSFGTLFECLKAVKFNDVEVHVFFDDVLEPLLVQFNESTAPTTTEGDQAPPLTLPGAGCHFVVAVARLPMFWSVLARPFARLNGESLISMLFSSLQSPMIGPQVVDDILGGLMSLLTLQDEPSMVEYVCPEVGRRLGPQNEVNFGTHLVVGQLDKILAFLTSKITGDVGAARSLPVLYLNVLNKLSDFVNDAEIGRHFANVLLTFLERGKLKSEEKVTAMLQSIGRLTHFIDAYLEYLARLTRMLTTVTKRSCRDALVDVVVSFVKHPALANDSENIAEYLPVLGDLEAWDSRRLNELDFERRHTALARLDALYRKGEVKLHPLVAGMLMRSHVHSLMTTTDIAFRSSSASTFHELIAYCAAVYSGEEQLPLVRQHLTPLIVSCLRANGESVCHEAIKSLDILVRLFGSSVPALQPLRQLQNEDREIDFFENIAHIQIHRRQRACKRLALQLTEGQVKISFDCLMRFIYPMIRRYFLVTDSNFATLSDEALNLFKETLRRSPWSKYYRLLSTYIEKLAHAENSKPVTRVIVAIIEAFHYDLSNCELDHTEFTAARNPRKFKRQLGSKLRNFGRNLDDEKETAKKAAESTAAPAPPTDEKADEAEEKATEEAEDDDLQVVGDEAVLDEPAETTDAKEILRTVIAVVLPKLQECIKPNQKGLGHKKSQTGKFYTEDEELKRCPIVLATVKLLQKTPRIVLDQHLHGVVLTLVSMLLSRSLSVRKMARQTMERVIQALGPSYLNFFLRELKQLMTKGYQVHVMIYTVHMLIQCLESQLKTGDLDASLSTIVEICLKEQFSDVTDEKELSTVVPEAKAKKTGETMQFLGRFVTCGVVQSVIDSMKKTFAARPSSTTMRKLSSLLLSFSNGLRANQGVAAPDLLNFTFGLLETHVADMTQQIAASQPARAQKEKEQANGYRPESCYLLPAAPKRQGVIVKSSIKAQSSIFVDFGLGLLHNLLKVKAFSTTVPEDAARLDPFLSIVLSGLKLKYEKITGAALRCLNLLLKFDLPHLEVLKKDLIDRLFVILLDYSAQPNATALNQALFQCIIHMVRKAESDVLTSKRTRILLNYVEADVLDAQRQVTAFALAKTIISKKIDDEKVTEVMRHFSKLAVTSTVGYIRNNCRDVLIHYFTLYSLTLDDAERWLTFFLDQLEYHHEDGRLSALEMVSAMLNAFTSDVNNRFAMVVFLKFAARLVNDESDKCKKFIAAAVHRLVQVTSDKAHAEMASAAADWVSSDKPGTQLVGLRALKELIRGMKGHYVGTMTETVTSITEVLCLQVGENDDKAACCEEIVTAALAVCRTLCEVAPRHFLTAFVVVTENKQFLTLLKTLIRWNSSRAIQEAAADFVGQLFGALKAEGAAKEQKQATKAIESHLSWIELTLALCYQLRSSTFAESGVDQVIKNLAFIFTQLDEAEEVSKFIDTAVAVCSVEINKFPKESFRRAGIFKLAAACVMQASSAVKAFTWTQRVMPFLYREMSGRSGPECPSVQSLANEVGELLKEKVGMQEYTQLLIDCTQKASEKAIKRKVEKKQLVVKDPAAAAAVKRRKHLKNAQLRKRKLDVLKPYRVAKRRHQEQHIKDLEAADAELFSGDDADGDE